MTCKAAAKQAESRVYAVSAWYLAAPPAPTPTPCPLCLTFPCLRVPTNTLLCLPASALPFVPIKHSALVPMTHPALCAYEAPCPLCLSYLKLASQVLGVPHSSGEPAVHQLLVGIPARRQGLCKGGQAKGQVVGQVVPNCRLVTVAHHLKDHCEACSGINLCDRSGNKA